jgi:hypothetical protein
MVHVMYVMYCQEALAATALMLWDFWHIGKYKFEVDRAAQQKQKSSKG